MHHSENFMKITIENFKSLISDNIIKSGDIICIENGESGLLGKIISNVQYNLLMLLDPNIKNEIAKETALFTHSAIIISPEIIAEMKRPIGRLNDLNEALKNECKVIIKRPTYLAKQYHDEEERGDAVANLAVNYVKKEHKYPFFELLTYYLWSLKINKIIFNRKFIDIFKDDKDNVCSGFCWEMCLKTKAINENLLNDKSDKKPECWYPARLVYDTTHFRTIGIYEIIN